MCIDLFVETKLYDCFNVHFIFIAQVMLKTKSKHVAGTITKKKKSE